MELNDLPTYFNLKVENDMLRRGQKYQQQKIKELQKLLDELYNDIDRMIETIDNFRNKEKQNG